MATEKQEHSKASVQYVPDAATVEKAVETQRTKLLDGGMSRFSFFLGTVNFAIVFFIIGRAPEHYWIYHTIMAFLLAVGRVYRGLKLQNLLCLLDFCWIANLAVGVYCVTLLVDTVAPTGVLVPYSIQVDAYFFFFGLAAGPLAWSVFVTGNALVFHSIDQSAALFIHASPMVMMWCVRWHGAKVFDSYPNLLPLQDILKENQPLFRCIYARPALFYLLWWFPFSLWMLFHGRFLRKPHAKQKTTYSILCESSHVDQILQRTFGIKSDFMAVTTYLVLHAISCNLALVLTPFLFHNYLAHTAHTILMGLVAVLNGAGSYNYFIVESYRKAVKRALTEEPAKHGGKQE